MTPFLANENIPRASILLLRGWGYCVASILEESPGIADVEVLERAVKERLLLLTFDRDYGELIYRRNLAPPPGIVFFRFTPVHPSEPAEILKKFLDQPEISSSGKFTILERERVRQRPL